MENNELRQYAHNLCSFNLELHDELQNLKLKIKHAKTNYKKFSEYKRRMSIIDEQIYQNDKQIIKLLKAITK